MKIKKLAALFLAVTLVCALAAPAFADTTDTYDQHYWSGNDRFDATPYRTKDNSSRVYFRIANNSLPIGGVDFQSQLANVNGGYVYSNWFPVTRNASYALNHNAGGLASGRSVRLTTYYPATRYSWGHVALWWSPDYVSDGSTLLG